MSDFDYALEMEDFRGGFGGGYGWQKAPPPPPPQQMQWNYNEPPRPPGQYHPRRSNSGFRNAQYSEAYGDYRGGYGPGGGFGAPPPRFQPYPQGRPPRGYGFGPVGQPPQNRPPPVHRAVLLLEKCEVERQYIKLIPHHILDMIDSKHCGICGMDFDTLHMTKVHYKSKNHVKALKKLMGHHKNAKNIHEFPIKARNLFCELCDVHITSTAHADSHYSGKSHRSIVEGRKPCKNPVLLQRGMEARVEQLIRREKKHLKICPELDSSEEQLPPNDKSMPPELICNICKIIVSCSDQMTSHLNGKKHLTKEKQHILKMMKGSAEQTNADKSGGEKAEAVVDQEDTSGGETAEAVVAQEDKSGGKEAEAVVAQEDKSDGEMAEAVVAQDDEGEDEQGDKPVEDTDDDWGNGDGADWDTYTTAQ